MSEYGYEYSVCEKILVSHGSLLSTSKSQENIPLASLRNTSAKAIQFPPNGHSVVI